MDESESQETEWNRVLQRSVEARMRAIQEKISLACTFCSTVEIAIQYGHFDRAKELQHKLRSTVEALTDHLNNPQHVSAQQSMEFREQLVQLRKRLAMLESQIREADLKGWWGSKPQNHLS